MSEYLRIGDGAFILIKIDNFEQIKEKLWEKIGDIVLCETADILRAFEQTDYVCRFDTDEFVLFLKEAGLVRNIGLTFGVYFVYIQFKNRRECRVITYIIINGRICIKR